VGDPLEAEDEDAGDEGKVYWEVISGDEGGLFKLVGEGETGATIQLTQAGASALDYESKPVHVLTVRAYDGGSPSLSSFVNVTIQLLDTNEAPVLQANQELRIGELAALRAPLLGGSLNASDPEDGTTADGKLQFEILGGDSRGAFDINAGTGQIFVADASKLDHETVDSIDLLVRVRDSGATADGIEDRLSV